MHFSLLSYNYKISILGLNLIDLNIHISSHKIYLFCRFLHKEFIVFGLTFSNCSIFSGSDAQSKITFTKIPFWLFSSFRLVATHNLLFRRYLKASLTEIHGEESEKLKHMLNLFEMTEWFTINLTICNIFWKFSN